MPNNGRVIGCYGGRHGEMTRVYDPEKDCKDCGSPAAYRQEYCHDCLSEQSVDYMPDPETIKAECAEIRKEWTDLRYNRGDEETRPYEIPEVRLGMLFR